MPTAVSPNNTSLQPSLSPIFYASSSPTRLGAAALFNTSGTIYNTFLIGSRHGTSNSTLSVNRLSTLLEAYEVLVTNVTGTAMEQYNQSWRVQEVQFDQMVEHSCPPLFDSQYDTTGVSPVCKSVYASFELIVFDTNQRSLNITHDLQGQVSNQTQQAVIDGHLQSFWNQSLEQDSSTSWMILGTVDSVFPAPETGHPTQSPSIVTSAPTQRLNTTVYNGFVVAFDDKFLRNTTG